MNEIMTRRAGAYLIDSVITIALLFLNGVAVLALVLPYGNERPPVPALLGLALFMLVNTMLSFGFFLIRDSFAKGSPGKRMLGLRVVGRGDGAPCTPKQSCIRNGILLAIGIIDIIFAFTREDGRRLGDELAGTKVVLAEER